MASSFGSATEENEASGEKIERMRSSGTRGILRICELIAGDPIKVTETLVESLPVDRMRRGRRIDKGIDGGVTPISGADGFPESMGVS